MQTWFVVAALLWGLNTEPAPFGFGDGRICLLDSPAAALPDFDDSRCSIQPWYAVTERDRWWLRREVRLPPEFSASPVPVALYVVATASSEVWWDGRLLGRNGKIDETAETPGRLSAVYPLERDQLTEGAHLLAIRFSAQHAGRAIVSPVDEIFFASFGDPLRFSRALYLPSMLAAGALLFALALLAIMWVRAQQPAAAWLMAAGAAALIQFGAEVLRAFVNYPYDWHHWRLGAVGLATAATGTAMIGYLRARFSDRSAARSAAGTGLLLAGILSLGWIPAIDLGIATDLVVLVWLLGGVVLSLQALRSGRREALPGLVVLVAMTATLFVTPQDFIDRGYYLGVVLLLIVYFFDYARRYAQTRRERDTALLQAARLELELLKRHLRPHFLLNTLNTLAEWLETDPPTGARMIESLAREFRRLDRIADASLIDLDEELALCRAHLEVMGFRRDCRYELRVEGPTGFRVPPAILHTLVENAISHNDYGTAGARFDLTIKPTAEDLELVFTSPPGRRAARGDASEGTGLSYVRARLREAFGEACSMSSERDDVGWVTRIRCPAVAAGSGHPETLEQPVTG